jgi:hypothetical protein
MEFCQPWVAGLKTINHEKHEKTRKKECKMSFNWRKFLFRVFRVFRGLNHFMKTKKARNQSREPQHTPSQNERVEGLAPRGVWGSAPRSYLLLFIF